MREDDLAQVLVEVDGVLKAVGVRGTGVRVLACDTAVQAARTVRSSREVQLLGGGGTDMAAGIEAAVETRPRPQIVVVLTDGFTPWPAEAPPGVRVIVVLVGQGRRAAPRVPEWARVVVADETDGTG
jgi:predicted metal-dependent peptidase